MNIEFYIDSDTGVPHIARHRVEKWEAVDVLENAQADYNARDGTRAALGQTRDGRYLRVIYRRLDGGDRRIITAFDLSPSAKRALRRSRRRRQ
jgi:6-phosphogluconolactonase (cycloisomerase 2 family)